MVLRSRFFVPLIGVNLFLLSVGFLHGAEALNALLGVLFKVELVRLVVELADSLVLAVD